MAFKLLHKLNSLILTHVHFIYCISIKYNYSFCYLWLKNITTLKDNI